MADHTQTFTLAAAGIHLPLALDPEEPGNVVDATGTHVLQIDINRDRSDAHVRAIAEAVISAVNASASPSGWEVAVEALEWRRGYCDDQVIIEQASFGGLYQVRQFDGDIWLDHPSASSSKHETVGAAKAAAQADFERRIRSALISPEAPQASEVMRAAERLLTACVREFGWQPNARTDEPCGTDQECEIKWGDLLSLHAALAKIGGGRNG